MSRPVATSEKAMVSAPPESVAEVLSRFAELEAALPRADGVACFTRMYRQVTEAVERELGGQTFADPRFLARLDVVFAKLFFSALESYTRDREQTPAAWLPLFDCRERQQVAPLQFALAGMNAHINRDLPVALVTTCAELGLELSDDTAEHHDYLQVNPLLSRVEAEIKASYLTGWLARVDRLLHRVHRIDDVVAMWDIRRARDAAWANGRALWALRGDPALSAEFVAALDRMVGLTSRGLLAPAETWLQKAGRIVHQLGGS